MRGRYFFTVVAVVALMASACDPDDDPGNATPSATPVSSSPPIYRLVEDDLVYRTVDGIELGMDVYGAEPASDRPAVMLIHGGAWKSGDKRDWARIGGTLADAGFVAFAPAYRLAPPGGSWTAPAQVEDLQAAIAWIRENGADYGAATERIGAIGSSAGGHLAMMLASDLIAPEDRLAAIVAWSPPTDLKALYRDALHRENVLGYIGCHLEDCPERYADQSPINHVDATTAPTLIVNSEQELMPLSQSVVMARALEAADVPVKLHVLPGNRHAQSYSRFVLAGSVAWLRTHLI